MAGVPGQVPGSRQAAGKARVLPMSCSLPAPPLPGGRTWTGREQERWAELWGTGPANLWDEACVGLVALLVVLETQMLGGKATAAMVSEIRQLSDQLALSPSAQFKLQVRFEDA